MRRTLLAIVGLGVAGAIALAPHGISADEAAISLRAAPPAAGVDAIRWETSWSAAAARARQEGKPILALSLFGRLDEEFC